MSLHDALPISAFAPKSRLNLWARGVLWGVLDGPDGEGGRPSTLPCRSVARRRAWGQAEREDRGAASSDRGRRLVSEIGVLPTAERFSPLQSLVSARPWPSAALPQAPPALRMLCPYTTLFRSRRSLLRVD